MLRARAFRPLRLVAALALLALPPAAGEVRAQSAGGPGGGIAAGDAEAGDAAGRVTTHAFGPVAAGETVLIDVLDDTDLNLRLRDTIAEALRARGFAPGEGGRYTLLFQSQEVRNLSGDGGIGELSVTTGEGIRMHMNLWSSTRDSLLTGRAGGAAAPALLHLDMTLRETGGERTVVWQGQAFARARGVDRFAVYDRMVPPLLDRLGETRNVESFPLE